MSVKFPADPTNLIELPGVGKVPRPTDIDGSNTGFEKLVSLRIYDFSAGQMIHGEAEGDEVIIVFLQGSVSVTVTGAQTETWEIRGRESVFAGPAQAVYLPPGYEYRLELRTDAQVAYARARAEGRFPPRLIEGAARGQGETNVHKILGPSEAEALECFEVVVPGGASYAAPEVLSAAESLTHYRLEPTDGSARHRTEEGGAMLTVADSDTVATKGRSTVKAVSGQRLYGLTVLVKDAG